MGLYPRSEARTNDGLFSIDLAVKWKGRWVAVEVDGGWHYTRSDTPRRALGQAMAKWRCLEMRGWRVVSIPWFEWFELQEEDSNSKSTRVERMGQDEEQLEEAGDVGRSRSSEKNSNLSGITKEEYLRNVLDGTLWRMHQTSVNNKSFTSIQD